MRKANKKMVRKRITETYIFLLLVFFPLCFWDYYYDIANVKFIVFTSITLGSMVAFLIYRGCYQLIIQVKWIILWCIINMISFLISSYKKTALIGTKGRNYGLITILCITIMFIIVVSEIYKKEKFINGFIISSVLVSVLAIMNSYGIDLIGFYKGVRMDLRMFYQTTLGHVDICSSFFALALPIAAVTALKEEKNKRRVIYFISSLIIFAGQFGGGCDSGYINIAVLVIFLLFYIKDYKRMFLFLLMELLMLFTAKFMMIINQRIESARKMDSISVIITDTRVVLILSVSLIFLILLCFIMIKSGKTDCIVLKKAMLFCICTAAGIFGAAFIYFSFIDRKSDLGSLTNLLRFGDEWGSCRGYIWKVSFKHFLSLPWYNKILGTGPDTLECVLTPVYGEEMIRRFDAFYDNAHNEYLQYLITSGIAGLSAYMGFVVSSIKIGITSLKHNENIAPFMAAAVCYLVQATVNINQVITTPLMFLCLAMIAFYKEE